MKYVIPIETKKWWQIWKKSDQKKAKEKLAKLLESYNTDIKISEGSEIKMNAPDEGEDYRCPYCGKRNELGEHLMHVEYFHENDIIIYE